MSDYHPISCAFHDMLELLATTRQNAAVEYRDVDGTVRKINTVILDVYVRDRAEYLALNSGETLRLDKLVSVNGARLADY